MNSNKNQIVVAEEFVSYREQISYVILAIAAPPYKSVDIHLMKNNLLRGVIKVLCKLQVGQKMWLL